MDDEQEHASSASDGPSAIGTSRLEAFSDGVIAVIITIMVLELRPPQGADLTALLDLKAPFLIYALSFIFIAIYWNNHHHLLRATRSITGGVMWANLFLLFWLSLIPVSTAWVGPHPTDPWPAVLYGAIGFLAGVAYYILTRTIIAANKGTAIEAALGTDFKGKVSIAIYALGMALAALAPLLSYLAYAAVAVMWFIPDRRLTGRQ